MRFIKEHFLPYSFFFSFISYSPQAAHRIIAAGVISDYLTTFPSLRYTLGRAAQLFNVRHNADAGASTPSAPPSHELDHQG